MYSVEEKLCILFGDMEISSKKFFALQDFFGDIATAAEAILSDSDAERILGENYKAVKKALQSGKADKIIQNMEKNGVFAVTVFSPYFPQSLREIDDPPYNLFCKGNADLLASDCIAVVGTRKVSSYGRRIATDFTKVLCEHFTIVSGLAYGADSVAHETTLEFGGKTIAVLGSGVVNVYPATNQNLSQKIVESGGLLVSEYGTESTPVPYHFPHRNRIVSGLSKGLLVCQAPLKSGTLSTVELALDQGKDVFVVPGEIYDNGYTGSNNLIKSMQGACVTTPMDICDYYRVGVCKQEHNVVQLDFDEQKVADALSEGPLTFDRLVEKTKIRPADLNFLLANLELKSIIAKLPGNSYRLYGGIE